MLGRQEIDAMIMDEIRSIWSERDEPGPVPAIGPDENLFDVGVVDSFGMIQMVDLVERLVGTPVDFMAVDPAVFFTIGGIRDYIVAELPSNAAEVTPSRVRGSVHD